MEDIKAWVLHQLVKEREITRMETEHRCKELVHEICIRTEKTGMTERNSWINDTLSAEMTSPSEDWMYICRKETQKIIEDWLKEDRIRTSMENNLERKQEEKRKEEERRRLEKQTFALTECLKKIKRKVCELEEFMKKEKAMERKKTLEYITTLKAEMEKETDRMRQCKESIQSERRIEKEDLIEYVLMIQTERHNEREECTERMNKMTESQMAIEQQRELINDRIKTIEQQWTKEKKWMAQCIEEEEDEKLEMKRAMWWMSTERNQERQQLKVFQQRDEMRMREMEQMKREMNDRFGAQREILEDELKDREMRMQLWERKQEMISRDQQTGWMTARLELQKEKRNRAKCEWTTNELARDMYLHNVEMEDKFLNIVRDFGREKTVKRNKSGFLERLRGRFGFF